MGKAGDIIALSTYLYTCSTILLSQPNGTSAVDATIEPNKIKPGISLSSQGNKAIVPHLTTVGLSARCALLHLSALDENKGYFFFPSPRLNDDAKQSGRACSAGV